jgi:hypothetical protein
MKKQTIRMKQSDNHGEDKLAYQKKLHDILLEGNDWAIVIKAHAAIESIVEFSLKEYKKSCCDNKKSMVQTFLKSHNFEMRFAVAVLLNMIPEVYVEFVCGVRRLRNKLAHDVDLINFKFSENNKSDIMASTSQITSGVKAILDREVDVLCQDVSWAVVKMYKKVVEKTDDIPGYGAITCPLLTCTGSAI